MTIKEIHFNHDPGIGAIPLSHAPGFGREGQPSEITAPEWREGASEPVAYARGEVKGPVIIKVRFTNGPPRERVTIRAVGPLDPQLGSAGLDRATTALGEVRPGFFAFDDNGDSGLVPFELSGDISREAVGRLHVVWNWQVHVAGEKWRDFATTYHYVAITLKMPPKRWLKSTVQMNVGPWVEAMLLAIEWADGANSVDDTILRIATAINQHPKLVYDKSGKQFVQDKQFLLSNLLNDFRDASSIAIDCQGVANMLVIFAHLVGVELRVLHLENDIYDGAAFTTKPIQALRSGDWTPFTWKWHELAVDPASTIVDKSGGWVPLAAIADEYWLDGALSPNLKVYDANLHLNEPAPVFPIGIRLGLAGSNDHTYRDLFVSSGTAARAKPLASLPTI